MRRWSNTKGLEVLGLTEKIPVLSNGIVETDDTGKANGILRESAQNIVWDNVGVPSLEDLKNRIADACLDAASKGITALQTDDFEAFTGDTADLIMRAYIELAAEGKLPVRVYQQCLLRTPEKLRGFLDKGYKTGSEYGFYKIGPLKLLNDGSLGARDGISERTLQGCSGDKRRPAVRSGKPYRNDPSWSQ